MIVMARVVKVRPESNAVDIVLMDDHRRFGGVHVLQSMAGGNVGIADLPIPKITSPGDPFESTIQGERDIYAIVSFLSRDQPIVLGFIYPEIAECLFLRENWRIDRHASDTYSTINQTADRELYHPSGTYVRMADDMEHEVLEGQDYDKKFTIRHNKDTAPSVRLRIKNHEDIKTTIDIDKDGNITITNIGNTSITTQGTTDITSVGNMSLHTDGTMAISAVGPVNVTGATINLN